MQSGQPQNESSTEMKKPKSKKKKPKSKKSVKFGSKSHKRRKRRPTSGSERRRVAKKGPVSNIPTTPSYEVHNIAVDQIVVSGNRRQFQPEKAEDLKGSIAKIGLRTPLTIEKLVWGKKRLLTGVHRLAAVKALGWETVPCVYFTGGKKEARLWEISENLHRAELTALEESEHIAEWLELTKEDETVSAQNGQKGKTGRPKGGVSDAARKLPGKGTQAAKRHKITRAAKIAGIDAEVKRQIVDAGLADKPTKLNAIASKPDKNAQLKELRRLKAGRRKRDEERPENGTDDETTFDLMKRQWLEEKKLSYPVWERATFRERTDFIVKVLEHPLDGVDPYEDEHDDEN
jgi:ParB-like chromosome segregation protein Spo0J